MTTTIIGVMCFLIGMVLDRAIILRRIRKVEESFRGIGEELQEQDHLYRKEAERLKKVAQDLQDAARVLEREEHRLKLMAAALNFGESLQNLQSTAREQKE